MLRYLLLLPLVMFLLNWSTADTQSAVPDSPAAYYKVWIGKFPSDRVRGKTFLEQPDVRRRISRTLGLGALSEMNKMRTSFRTQEHKNWLLVSGCQPHMCVDAQWTIAIHLTSGETRTCLASLAADFVQFGASNRKPIRVPREQGEGCPEGEKVTEQFDRLFPAELR